MQIQVQCDELDQLYKDEVQEDWYSVSKTQSAPQQIMYSKSAHDIREIGKRLKEDAIHVIVPLNEDCAEQLKNDVLCGLSQNTTQQIYFVQELVEASSYRFMKTGAPKIPLKKRVVIHYIHQGESVFALLKQKLQQRVGVDPKTVDQQYVELEKQHQHHKERLEWFSRRTIYGRPMMQPKYHTSPPQLKPNEALVMCTITYHPSMLLKLLYLLKQNPIEVVIYDYNQTLISDVIQHIM